MRLGECHEVNVSWVKDIEATVCKADLEPSVPPRIAEFDEFLPGHNLALLLFGLGLQRGQGVLEQLRAADRRCAASTDDETTSDIRQRGGQRHGGLRGECKAQDGNNRVTGADDIIDFSSG